LVEFAEPILKPYTKHDLGKYEIVQEISLCVDIVRSSISTTIVVIYLVPVSMKISLALATFVLTSKPI